MCSSRCAVELPAVLPKSSSARYVRWCRISRCVGTFIVGYPSETQADFDELCDFVSEVKLDRVGAFLYSQEDDTYAYILGDSIPSDVKEERKKTLMEIQKGISLEKNQAKIGSN